MICSAIVELYIPFQKAYEKFGEGAARCFAERDHSRITSWNELPGVTGHYSAHTNPGQLAADIRGFFRPLRPAPTNGSATSSTTKEI